MAGPPGTERRGPASEAERRCGRDSCNKEAWPDLWEGGGVARAMGRGGFVVAGSEPGP